MRKNKKLIILALVSLNSIAMRREPLNRPHRIPPIPKKTYKIPPIPKKTYKMIPKPGEVYKTLENTKIEFLDKNSNSVKLWIDDIKKINLNQKRVEEIVNNLEKNPINIVQSIGREIEISYPYEMFTNSYSIQKAEIETEQSLKKIIEDASKTKYHEIFLLYECNDILCKLSRSEKVDPRTKFEDKLVSKVKFEEVTHASIASGDLFPDLRIAVKLIKKGKKINGIHLIDIQYEDALNILKNSYQKPNDLKPHNISIDDIHRQLKLYIRNVRKNNSDEVFYKKLEGAIDIIRFAQFARFLSYLSKKQIPIYIHENISEYVKLCKKNSEFKANLLLGIDFFMEDVENELKKLKSICLKKPYVRGELYKEEIIKEIIVAKS